MKSIPLTQGKVAIRFILAPLRQKKRLQWRILKVLKHME